MARFGNLPPGRLDFLRSAADRGGASRMGSSTAALNFPLLFPPTLLSVTPSSGPLAGGTAVILGGLHFQIGATVTFGGVPATSIVVNSSSSISCTTPAGAAAGAVDVTVTNPDSQSSTLTNGYTYLSLRVVAVASAGTIAATSDDGGFTWTQRVIPSGQYGGLAQGLGQVVAVGESGVPINGAFSSDRGATWASASMPGASIYLGVAFSGSIFASYSGSVFATSNNGHTWTQHPGGGFAIRAHCITWASTPGQFVVGQQNGVHSILTSPDGTSLTTRNTPDPGGPVAALLAVGSFVVALPGATSNGIALFSIDGGSNWSSTLIPGASNGYQATAFGNGLFVAIGNSSSATSPDGITWTGRSLPAGFWNDVTFVNGIGFVLVGNNSQGATSPDGITWTPVTLPGPSVPYNRVQAIT